MAALALASETRVAHLFCWDPEAQGAEGRLILEALLTAQCHWSEPASSPLKAADFPQVGTKEWGEMNRKRAELIRKMLRGELSLDERELLETLQRRSREELERAFPRGKEEAGEG